MPTYNSPKAGVRFGDWELIEFLGRGGNGTVWKASDRGGRIGAIKFLHRRHRTDNARYRRFKHEVEAMLACGDIHGVLPLLDSYTPESPDPKDKAWLVSAYATPLEGAFGDGEGLEAVVRLCASLAETLSAMHERGYSHRDIKPENIFLHEDVWCLGDFGLVDFPDKSALTIEGEKLGPVHYIAPEMLNDAAHADGCLADVYSLGKLLWKLATGQKYPLPGMQSADEPALTISAYVDDGRAHTLDRVLEAATQVEPLRRPSMKDFAKPSRFGSSRRQKLRGLPTLCHSASG